MTLYRFLVCLLFLFPVKSCFFARGNLFISDKTVLSWTIKKLYEDKSTWSSYDLFVVVLLYSYVTLYLSCRGLDLVDVLVQHN